MFLFNDDNDSLIFCFSFQSIFFDLINLSSDCLISFVDLEILSIIFEISFSISLWFSSFLSNNSAKDGKFDTYISDFIFFGPEKISLSYNSK